MSEITGQDEARRVLADKILHEREYAKAHGFMRSTLFLTYEDAGMIAAALRAPSLDRGAEEIEDRLDRYEEALHDIQRWSEAYPLTVFPEPDLKKARALLEAGGMTLDSISAYCMRHVVEGVGKIARRALPVPADLNDGGGNG